MQTRSHDHDPTTLSHMSDLGSGAHSSSPPEGHSTTDANGGSSLGTLSNPAIAVQSDSETVVEGMTTLSRRVIENTKNDYSLPYQYSPDTDTHVQLSENIIMWFQDEEREKALLWLNDPAGVKPAVIQTVAESLAESNSVGATIFFSRLNDCIDPQHAFIAITFQLATGIPAYKIYITKQMALDPSLLEKEIRELFRIVIEEPFGNQGIGKGEGPRAILLDGLDECEGLDEQCKIVRLISDFVLKFPGASLVWVITSRPEPHIIGTFNDEAVASSSWSKFIPVDSTQTRWNVNPSSPSETHSPSPISGNHSSPHMETRGDLIINEPINVTHSSFSPLPTEPRGSPVTSTIPRFLSSARDFVGKSIASFQRYSNPVIQGAHTGAGFFPGAHDFVINNPIIGDQRDSDTVTQGMKALSDHSMEGVWYDSSLRDPPPHCHPGTRVELLEKIVRWFHDNRREKALLWLSGPAGVGKSAVIQTVAESLAESNCVGATLFFSRPNNCNDPRRVFITIAFQLATRIPEYRTYIMEQIALDPNLLERGMKDQFRNFVTKPFGNQGIGKGEGPWAVLLDGLDECEEVDGQRRLVQLVSEFVLSFPRAPLVWAIASRPDPRIVATLNDGAVAPSYWSEYIPVNSTQACQDVEHYLDASFKDMRKLFPHLPWNWPSETQFLKLACGAQGLFAFARSAVRSMEDPYHADPVSRLDLILSILDGLDISVTNDHPFALLDALYTQTLIFTPMSLWPITSRILGFVIYTRSGRTEDGFSYPLHSSNRTLTKASIILGLELRDMYRSLHRLHSVLDIPDPKNADKSEVKCLHPSFGDYLADWARSKEFYVDRRESVNDVTRCLFRLYLDKPWDTNWERYAPQLSGISGPDPYEMLRKDGEDSVYYIVTGELSSRRGAGPFKSQEDRSECLNALGQINPIEVYKLRGFKIKEFCTFLLRLWDEFQEELKETGLFKMVPLRDLELAYEIQNVIFSPEPPSTRSRSPDIPTLPAIQENQRLDPSTPVMIYGSLPEQRIAFFKGKNSGDDEGYFCFPYPY